MAENTLFTPEQVTRSTIAATRYVSTLARRAAVDYSSDFSAGRGATVNVRRPIVLDPAREYGQADRRDGESIRYSALLSDVVPLTFDSQIYNAVVLPDEIDTFTLQDAETQLAVPMGQTVAEAINAKIVSALNTVQAGLSAADKAPKGKYVGEDGKSYDTLKALEDAGTKFVAFGNKTSVKDANLTAKTHDDVMGVIRYAKRLLDDRQVPRMGRILVVGSGWAQAILAQDNLQKAHESASDGALREAIIGRISGFEVIEESSLDPYAAYALDPQGVALALRAPRVPQGVSFGKSLAVDGFALRYIHDYDPDHLQDRAVVSVFATAAVVDPQRIVKLTGTEGFEEKKPATPAVAS